MEPDPGGLDFGITAYHIRILCEPPLNGGRGYTPWEVAALTPDQIYFLLCEKTLLERTPGQRIQKFGTGAVGSIAANKDGTLRGRAKDGTPINLRFSENGKSKVQLIRERLEKQKAEEAKQKKRKRRRGT